MKIDHLLQGDRVSSKIGKSERKHLEVKKVISFPPGVCVPQLKSMKLKNENVFIPKIYLTNSFLVLDIYS